MCIFACLFEHKPPVGNKQTGTWRTSLKRVRKIIKMSTVCASTGVGDPNSMWLICQRDLYSHILYIHINGMGLLAVNETSPQETN